MATGCVSLKLIEDVRKQTACSESSRSSAGSNDMSQLWERKQLKLFLGADPGLCSPGRIYTDGLASYKWLDESPLYDHRK
eukprot:1894492-Amphidinium_carterae.1